MEVNFSSLAEDFSHCWGAQPEELFKNETNKKPENVLCSSGIIMIIPKLSSVHELIRWKRPPALPSTIMNKNIKICLSAQDTIIIYHSCASSLLALLPRGSPTRRMHGSLLDPLARLAHWLKSWTKPETARIFLNAKSSTLKEFKASAGGKFFASCPEKLILFDFLCFTSLSISKLIQTVKSELFI